MEDTAPYNAVTIENLETAANTLREQEQLGAAKAIEDLIDEIKLKLNGKETNNT
jgi:hypothetical protein